MNQVHVIKGKYAHLGWVDIQKRGVVTEVAVLKNGPQGLSFIQINKLDAIDKQRLLKIITNRNAGLYELWDLMSNITLGNGANALEYFHQYVKVLTPSGELLTPSLSRMVDPRWTGVRQQHPVQQPVQSSVQQPTQQTRTSQPPANQQPPSTQQVIQENVENSVPPATPRQGVTFDKDNAPKPLIKRVRKRT